MPADTPRTSAGPGAVPSRSDIGRRVAARREQLGLSREEVAGRAGSAGSYLQYVEEEATVLGVTFLLRLANALETTVAELSGGTVDLPPGTGRAAHHPELRELSGDECRSLLGTHGVGRVVVTTGEGPAIVPVNYLVVQGNVSFRTALDALPARAAGTDTAFEADHIDDALSQGWSVLIVGQAHMVTDAESLRILEEHALTTPWAGGERTLWITIVPRRVTGRRIAVRQNPAAAGPSGKLR
ncbi:pyridoxamine 5'-phosphate oxidase family protein [Streptomyces sp. NPDC008139]|uniref:helix-turn-helix domain-containing protein n=1 Tax=Streptomyces sp. NPDC008139 TaxID=3364814 RepID=UPI0036E4ABBD